VPDPLAILAAAGAAEKLFVARASRTAGHIEIPGIPEAWEIFPGTPWKAACKFLGAVTLGGRSTDIAEAKGAGGLSPKFPGRDGQPANASGTADHSAAIADEQIPIQTIAPKFTGRFNKASTMWATSAQFEREFSDDIRGHRARRGGVLPASPI